MAQRKAVHDIETIERMFNNELLKGHSKLSSVSVRSRASSFAAMSTSSDGMEVVEHHNPLLVAGSTTHVKSGTFVEIDIRSIPVMIAQSLIDCSPLCKSMFSLLSNENKLSVLHFNLQLLEGKAAIRGKESLLFQVGFRTFLTKPIFSEANLNCDKHKMERFLQPNRFAVASIYAPITYLPSPLLVFRNDGNRELVAFGSLMSIDPDRIILKKVSCLSLLSLIDNCLDCADRNTYTGSKTICRYQAYVFRSQRCTLV